MFTTILTIAGLALKALGLVQWGESLVQLAQAKKAGMDAQKAADDAATVEAATKAARAGSEVAGESDADIVKDLSKDFRP